MATQRPVATAQRSVSAHPLDAHAPARSTRSTCVSPTAKRTDARCTATAVSRVQPSARAHPRASIHSGDVSPSSVDSTVTQSGNGRRPLPAPSAVTRWSRSAPLAPPRRISRLTDCTRAPTPHGRSVSTPTRSCVRGTEHDAAAAIAPSRLATRTRP